MRTDTLRTIILAALASTALGGSTACEDCIEHTDKSDFRIARDTFRVGQISALGAKTYEEWLDALANKPCDDLCQQFISESPVTVDQCKPLSREFGELKLHCEWTYRYCESQLTSGCASGRRPPGFTSRVLCSAGRRNAHAAFFARMAELESASVEAFEIVARDLTRLGAPSQLVTAARRAARDEVRHARAMEHLTRRFGGTTAAGRPASTYEARTLEELATENAIEGCARETYGAALATWMADNARDAQVRAVMRSIAHDETRHAALSWGIARWASTGLDRAARSRVAKARAEAVQDLAGELARTPPPGLIESNLAPSPAVAQRLLASLESGLRGSTSLDAA